MANEEKVNGKEEVPTEETGAELTDETLEKVAGGYAYPFEPSGPLT